MTIPIRDLMPAGARGKYDEAQQAEDRFDQTGDTEALAAAGLARQDVIRQLTAADGPAVVLFAVVHGLCRVLLKWYRATGDEHALDEVIRGARNVLAELDGFDDEQNPLGPSVLTELGNGLRARYGLTGTAADFDGARAAYQAAYDAQSGDPGYATNLASSYLDGYRRTGEISELAQAIDLGHEALGNTRIVDQLGEGIRSSNLAGSYLDAWQATSDPGALDRAINLCEAALHVLPASAPARAEAANNYGLALSGRYQNAAEPDPSDLDTAVAAHMEAAGLAPGVHRYYANLATALAERGDVDQAIEIMRDLLAELPGDSPAKAGTLANLGTALVDRNRPGDVIEATQVLQEAERTAIQPHDEIRAARSLGALASMREAWPEAAAAYRRALRAATRLFGVQATEAQREIRLNDHGVIAAEAAYAWVMAGDPAAAAQDLEAGRALQLTEALGLRSADLSALAEAGYGELGAEFDDAVAWWRKVAAESSDTADLGVRMQAARQRIASVTAQIRTVPGFSHFLVPAGENIMQLAAQSAPLVYLTAGNEAGLAIVVQPGGQAVVMSTLF